MKFRQQTDGCSDFDIVPDGQDIPAFRILLPEHLSATNIDLAAGWGVPTILHTVPGQWVQGVDRATGSFQAGRAFLVTVNIVGRRTYLDIELIVKNLTDVVLDNVQADVCLSFGHLPGNPDWHNPDFLAHDLIERSALGRYWYEKRTPHRLQAWVDRHWVGTHPHPADPDPDKVPPYFLEPGLITRVYAIESEDSRSLGFQMWNVDGETRAPFPGNACFHLRPRISVRLPAGETASITGKAGIFTGNRDQLLTCIFGRV